VSISSFFSPLAVDAKIYVPGNAAVTAANMLANAWLFRLGIFSDLVGEIPFLFWLLIRGARNPA
jgi:hypothetical protein